MSTPKEARSNREALKKAGRQERVPNLLLARLERQQARRTQAPFWPVWVVSILIFGSLAFVLRKNFRNGAMVSPVPANSALSTGSTGSTQTVALNGTTPAPEATATPPVTAPLAGQPNPVAAPAPVEPPKPEVPAPRFAQWKGFYSPVKKYREVIVDSDAAWADLWKEMGQPGAAPAIHFDDSAVVGIFLGDSPQGSDVVLSNPREYRRHVTIPFRITSPGAGAPGAKNVTQPFHLKIIPRTDKPIRFLQITEAPALTPATTTQP